MTFRWSVALIGVSLLTLAALSLLHHLSKQENAVPVASNTATEPLCILECSAPNCSVQHGDYWIESSGDELEAVCIQIPVPPQDLSVNWRGQDYEPPYVDPIFGGPNP